MDSTLQHRGSGTTVTIPTSPVSNHPPPPLRRPTPNTSKDPNKSPKIFEKIVALLILILLIVVFGYVFMLSTASSYSNVPANVYPKDRTKYDAVKNNIEHHGHQDMKEGGDQQHRPIELHHDDNPSNQRDDGVLFDAVSLRSLDDPHAAERNNLWKVSCVGKRPLVEQHQHQQSSAGSAAEGFCIMNLELVDRRDSEEGEEGPSRRYKGITFRERLGSGISRKHRPIPDDSLVQDFLFPKRVVAKAGNNNDAAGGDVQHQQQQPVVVETVSETQRGGSLNVRDDTNSNKAGFEWISPSNPLVSVEILSSIAGQHNHPDTDVDHTTTFKISGADSVKFFGLGNRGSSMKIPDQKPITLKNLDINHYKLDAETSLYGVVPLLYVWVKPKDGDSSSSTNNGGGVCIGIFVLNGSPMQVEANYAEHTIRFYTLGGGVRIFMLPGPRPSLVLRQYFHLTGNPAFPPLFALGYHQSRWTYRDQADVLQVHRGFDSHQLPCDVIWLDIDHTDDKRYFTWDRNKFPNPAEMQNTLYDESGRRLVTITDPHIKHDSNYHVFAQGRNGRHFVTHRDRRTFYGHCWPGESAWIDFLQEETRDWYASLFRYGSYHDSTPHLFSWIDMNEPSVFSGPDLTLPFSDAAHFNGDVMHKDVHNTYGFYHSMATFRGLFERDLYADKPTLHPKRPFVLTRSFFAGSHRFAAVWTGDNQGRWDHLSTSFDMTLMLSMGGIQLVGADVGGFFDSTEEHLLSSWYSAGVAYPFLRGHSHQDTVRREPWLIQGQYGQRVKRALSLRYRVIPYLYTCFANAHIFGEAVMRPLFFHFPELVLQSSSSSSGGSSSSNNKKDNSAEFFFWGQALMWRPFVREDELRSDEASRGGGVDVCGADSAASEIWLEKQQQKKSIPNFLSLCSMQWVNPGVDNGQSCTVSPSTCETPVFQRTSTIVVVAAHPSIKYDVASHQDDKKQQQDESSGVSTVTTVPRPRSTNDLLPSSSGKTSNVFLEVRIAFSLDMEAKPGDFLAYGTHYVDDGVSEFSLKHGAKYCLLQWTLHVSESNADALTLCAIPQPEEHNVLPPFDSKTCLAEMRRIRRFVVSAHVPDKNHPLAQIKVAKSVAVGAGEEDAANAEQQQHTTSVALSKTVEGSESYTWVVPWPEAGFKPMRPGGRWCLQLQ